MIIKDKEDKINKEKNTLINIQKIPDEIITIIFNYIPYKVKIFLNKFYYLNFHYSITDLIPIRDKENFIREIIRRDYCFVFNQILIEHYEKWIFNIKNYKYKNFIYKNYLYFIKDFCLFNESNKCINILNDFLQKHNLCQNQHKKNTVRNIRWKI